MFHLNLKYLRHRRQLSQQLLAEELGIPRTTYSEYEKGNTEPNLRLLTRMSELFTISLDQLIREDVSLGVWKYLKTTT
ncbi:MAG: helix-turn-helix transcriptional regulator [Saprospiraceae bacterium]|uniref:helix-turn-helix domain-containing protein n=1 Tax=Candidatus Brachybacter algidus TaxID=2982024 RepID=UPI00257B8664|nr:helix-turn-helix transcriptional regulator [Candidatus Brachybacter algidus]MBK7605449.1 helix-turn-helix transcriptional regulator [Candidatus Brachybacter algidus]